MDYLLLLMILFRLRKGATLTADTTVKMEQNLTLKCECPWSGNLSQINWERKSDSKKELVAVYNKQHGLTFSNKYEARIVFLNSSSMDGSITIINASAEDLGLYQCSIQTFPKGSWIKHLLVENSDGFGNRNSDSEELVEKGHHFMLRCHYVLNGTVYRVAIERIGEKHKDTIALCSFSDGKIIGPDYKERTLVNCSRPLSINLLLMNITINDEGVYRCLFSTDRGNHTTTISLSVRKEINEFMKIILTYVGAGAGGLVVFAVPIIATVVVCQKRRRKKIMRNRAKLDVPKRRQMNNYEHAAVYDRMTKPPSRQNKEGIYVNFQKPPHRTKKKT
ncbi:CD226 antigen-like [Acipenser ruthenus]|uniref:CD226 antigen-like n=1 Tax=Acipenser ruthenus TaxID=7906 RepID=UPI0027424B78|nr:CD226 antigen-like [Acipenser ruthenus]